MIRILFFQIGSQSPSEEEHIQLPIEIHWRKYQVSPVFYFKLTSFAS